MASGVFAFGPDDCWFMQSPSMWKWGTVPSAITKRFTDTTVAFQVAYVYSLVFGVNGSYMMTWKGKDGKDYQEHAGLPADLTAWLDNKDANGLLTRKISQIRLSLGPDNASYFVTDGVDYLWMNLPADLNNAVQKLLKPGGGFTDAPRLVALGLANSFVMITAGNGATWNVANEYPELNAWISKLREAHGNKGGMFASVSYLCLDAFDRQNYVLTTTGGGYEAWVPDALKDNLVAVLQSLPRGIAVSGQAQQQVQQVQQQAQAPSRQRARSSGLGSAFKLVGKMLASEMKNMLGAGDNSGGGGSGGDGSSGTDGTDGGAAACGQANVDYSQANVDYSQPTTADYSQVTVVDYSQVAAPVDYSQAGMNYSSGF